MKTFRRWTMARFYMTAYGQAKNPATTRGSEKSGMIVHVNGWDKGVKINAYVDDEGRDVFEVYETGGSRSSGATLLNTIIKEVHDG
jgi:hypothetical protein